MSIRTLLHKFEVAALIVLALLTVLAYVRPLPTLKPQPLKNLSAVESQTADMPWPSYGQAAFGAVGYGVLASHGAGEPVPMASIAKVITALTILEEKPLYTEERGPLITLTQQDIELYEKYFQIGGSVIPVTVGGQLTQYQALQALMLPSANNIADRLALWAFGSMENYLKAADTYVKSIGLNDTSIADATGFSDKTLSTPRDLIVVGEKALQNPVLAEIASQREANIPVAGVVRNVNWLLGIDGVVGIKTGNTDQAGGCYLFAAERLVLGQQIKVVGAIMGAPDLVTAITDSRKLINAGYNGFEQVKVLQKGQPVGSYPVAWNGNARAVAKDDLSLLNWKGSKTNIKVNLETKNAPLKKGSAVGFVEAVSGKQKATVLAVAEKDVASPVWYWRILR